MILLCPKINNNISYNNDNRINITNNIYDFKLYVF